MNRIFPLFDCLLSEGKGVRFVAAGSSMAPVIKNGDHVVVIPVAVDSVAIGDLILFRQPGDRMALHRVLRVIRDRSGRVRRFLTKGDAVDTPDLPVMAGDVLGRAVSIETASFSGVKCRRLDTPVAVRVSRITGVCHLMRSKAVQLLAGHGNDTAFVKPDRLTAQHQSHHLLHAINLGLHGKTPLYFIDWPEALRSAFAESLQSLLFKAAPTLRAPQSVIRTLENAYFTCLAENTRRIEAIKEVETGLCSNGLCVMVFKGAAVLGFAYEDPGLRPMEDIDIMARPGEEHAIEGVLAKAGFTREPEFSGRFARDWIRIDLHIHPLNADRVAARAGLLALDSAALFKRSLPLCPGMTRVRRPSDIDHVLILSHHMVKHSFSKLIWLEDIRRLLWKQDFYFLAKLNRTILAYGQERPMAYASYLACKIIKKSLYPDNIPVSPPFVALTRLEKALLDLRVSGVSIGDLGNLLWLFCLPDKRLVVRFAAQTLFPGPAVLERETRGRPGRSGRALYRQRTAEIVKRLMTGIPVLAGALRKAAS